MATSLTPTEADPAKEIEENLKNEQSVKASRRKQRVTPNLRVGNDFLDRVQKVLTLCFSLLSLP